MFSAKEKEAILDKVQIEDVVMKFIPDLQRSGNRYKCCCPVHGERTPSFIVSPDRNTFKCFGCGIGGNAISFLMDVQNMTYPEAMRWLADMYGIELHEDWTPQTQQEAEESMTKEAMRAAYKEATAFFRDRLHGKDDRAKFAYQYATKRWGVDYVNQEDIGFAPGHGEFMRWAESKGLDTGILLKLNLIREKDGRIYDGYYDRITIPIKDRYGTVIGFTARVLDGSEPKYLNPGESLIYSKGKSVFGIHNAKRQARREEKIFLVEGAPDVMRLQSMGINNTVAPLGTAWTTEQFAELKKYHARLCFIPDIDPVKDGMRWGAGIDAVIRNGIRAVEEGFDVTVKEITDIPADKKADPDSYFTSAAVFEGVPEADFIPWYARKLSDGKETSAEKAKVIKTVSEILAKVGDRLKVKMYVAEIAKEMNVPVAIMQNTVNETTKGTSAKKKKQSERVIDQDLYKKYGFYERGNRYMSMSKDGEDCEWSNFIMYPIVLVKDPISSKRIYRLVNDCNKEAIVELKTEDIVSLQRFKVRVANEGNFRWKAKEDNLNMLTGLLFEAEEPTLEIKQLGWQRQGFFAFGNGVQHDGKWVECDQYGIVRLGETGNFYLPSASTLYADDKGLYQFERRMVHTTYSDVTLRQYTDCLISVFGDNAKAGIAFLLATLFKDVVVDLTENFPILDLFGPKGSGKSTFGNFMMTFFVPRNKAVNLTQSTEAGLAAAVAQVANALVHIDEYKNSIDLSKREFIKTLYDGIGRTRMNMDRDKKRETTAVDCGVMLSGQEMPTVDIAIFARTLFLTFNKTEFSPKEKQHFNELSRLRDQGVTHLTLQILRHRAKFEEEFRSNYSCALSDLMLKTEGEQVEDRILRNWTIPLAAFRTLSGVLDIAFDYADLLRVCASGTIRQNSECRATNEVAGFWQAIDFLHQNGDIYIDADYRIKHEMSFKGKGMKEKMEFRTARPILYLCTKRTFMLYKKNGKLVGDATLSTDSLRFYLENSKEYIGLKNAVRFRNTSNDRESTATVTTASGTQAVQRTSRTDWALCFDYSALVENYGINLEVESVPDDEPDPSDIDTTDTSMPY